MAEHEHHCPFLNRPDERCSGYFHVDQLEHAYRHCFNQFHACPVYADRLEERQIRRQVDVLQEIVAQGVRHAQEHDEEAERESETSGGRPLVQVTISKRIARAFRRTQAAAEPAYYAECAAATEDVPALSGV